MKIKILSLAVSLAVLSLASNNAIAGLVIDDESPQTLKTQVQHMAQSNTYGSPVVYEASSKPKNLSIIQSDGTLKTDSTLKRDVDYTKYPVSKVLTEKGARPTYIQTAGWANDMPLQIALRQIVPVEFELQENGVILQNEVSWSGDKPWTDVLSQIALESGFVAHIDWERKNVSLAPAAFVVSEHFQEAVDLPSNQTSQTSVTTIVKEVSATSDTKKISQEISATSKSKSKIYDEKATVPVDMSDVDRSSETVITTEVVTQVPNSWILNPAFTLKENVEIWAKKAGWTVVWDASDYPIIASTNFGTGSLEDPNGPLARLISAYERSEQPLVAELTTLDKVIYVKNKYYERNKVLGTSPKEIAPSMFNFDDGAANDNPDLSLGGN